MGAVPDYETAIRIINEQDERIAHLESRVGELTKALNNLCDKLDEIVADDSYKSVFTIAFVHGCKYQGPSWEETLKQARATLAAAEGEGE